MRWHDGLDALFNDLEQQAQGLHLAERDAELAERSRAEYAQVALAGRLQASIGCEVRLDVRGLGAVAGVVTRVGRDWMAVQPTEPAVTWIVRTAALGRVRGLSPRSVSEEARPAVARLGLASVLRGLAEGASPVVVQHLDGTQARAQVLRVGADFVEVEHGDGGGRPVTDVLPFSGIAAVREA
jgi:hypothetical protein